MIMKRENSFKATFPSHIKDVKDGSNKWFLYNGSISLLLFWSAVKVRSLLRCFTATTDEAQLKEIYIYTLEFQAKQNDFPYKYPYQQKKFQVLLNNARKGIFPKFRKLEE